MALAASGGETGEQAALMIPPNFASTAENIIQLSSQYHGVFDAAKHHYHALAKLAEKLHIDWSLDFTLDQASPLIAQSFKSASGVLNCR